MHNACLEKSELGSFNPACKNNEPEENYCSQTGKKHTFMQNLSATVSGYQHIFLRDKYLCSSCSSTDRKRLFRAAFQVLEKKTDFTVIKMSLPSFFK